MAEREHLGYFEEFLLLLPNGCLPKGMGSRIFPIELPRDQNGRKLGFAGRREFTVTETIILNKGHRQVAYKASQQKPLQVSTMLQRMEGKELR